MKRRFYNPSRRFKLRESIRSNRRNRRLNEYKRWGNGPGFIDEYEGVLKGLDILHFNGNDYVDDLIEDEISWEENNAGDWSYEEKRDYAFNMLEDEIMNVDSTIDSMDVYDIVNKYFNEKELVSVINGYDPRKGDPIFGFSLFKEYGDWRGNQVEWVFNEEFLDEAVEHLVEDFNYSRSEARRKILNCCREISNRVEDSVSVELGDYVPF